MTALLALVATLLVTFGLTPIVARALRSRGRLDIPNARSSHSEAVPRGGGIACAGGTVAGIAVYWPEWSAIAVGVVLSVLLLVGVGYADDRLSLPAPFRLLAQVGAGALMGATVSPLWVIVGAATFPVVVNCVNFMDGINGLTSVTMAVVGCVYVLLAGTYGLPTLSVVGLVMGGAALGFLPWNIFRARIFLGDVGSYLFGSLAAAGAVLALYGGVPVMVTIAPMLTYLFDVGITLLRRAARKASLMEAHREHIYQRLSREAGLTHGWVLLYVAVVQIALVCAWLLAPPPVAGAFTVLCLAQYTLAVPLGRRLALSRQKGRSV